MAAHTAKQTRRETFVFRVGGREVRGATAAEALLRALALVRPGVVPQMSGGCPESVKIGPLVAA